MSTEHTSVQSSALASEENRKTQIIRVSIIGIVANVALAAFKAAVGALSGSIAIVLDAVNNLSDAASSLITIVGTKLAGKPADRAHPFGYGRIEYLTTIVVAVIVLWAGVTSFIESVRAILHPEAASYEPVTLGIVAVAVLAKFVLGHYFKAAGARLGSGSLVASGEDASMDAVISASTLVAAGMYLAWGVSFEAWLGAIISAVIIESGLEILNEALDKILGERANDELAVAIKDSCCEVEGVRGAYDLLLNDYGPERLWGSVHVEVDETLNARQIDTMTREIQQSVLSRHQVVLHTVGVYSTNTADSGQTAAIREALNELIAAEEHALQVHGLYVDEGLKRVSFDLVVSFGADDREAVRQRIVNQLHKRFSGYNFSCVLDADISN